MNREPRHQRGEREKSEFTERVLEINRVTRVVKGGKRMRFRALVVIGDEKGRISCGLGKAGDVSTAVGKAVASARKHVITIYRKSSSIPYPVESHYKSAHVLLKPAPAGTGIIAGGAMRVVLQLAGVKDVVGKALGSQNKNSNALATISALALLRDRKQFAPPGEVVASHRSSKADK